MTDFTFITCNDIHISDYGPRGRIDDFKSTILNKLDQIRSACAKLNADGMILAGDLFNIKCPSKNSHRLNSDLSEIFKSFICPIYMIEGNHDLTANNINSISEQPLGVLFKTGVLNQLRHTIIEKDNYKVSLVGVPYTEDINLTSLSIPPNNNYVAQICAMHLYSSLKPAQMFKEKIYGYNELEKLSPNIFILGHYHLDQGITELNNKYFINIGSLTRGTIADEDISHQPQMGLIKINVEDGKIRYLIRSIKLKVKPSNEIFDLNKKFYEKKEREEIELFVEALVEETLKKSVDKKFSINDNIQKLDMSETIKSKVLSLIHEATLKRNETLI